MVYDLESGAFLSWQKIEGLCGVRPYTAQARPKIDTARAEKVPFRTESK
jgi:hypothetical protein